MTIRPRRRGRVLLLSGLQECVQLDGFIKHQDAATAGKPQAQNFNFDDQGELKARYPRLWKKFGR